MVLKKTLNKLKKLGKLMNILKKIAVTFSLLAISTSIFASSSYEVDSDHSIVNFSVTKKQYIIEPATFEDVSGTIDKEGNVTINIDMNSVDSSNPIRDDRLIDMFFQAEFFPEAILSAKIKPSILNSKETIQKVKVNATLEFFEIKKDIVLEALVVKTGSKVVVSSLKPIIVNAKMFNVPMENLNALSKVCGGITISDIVPVNFVITFQKK